MRFIRELKRFITLELAIRKCERSLRCNHQAVDFGVVRAVPSEPNESIEKFTKDFRRALWAHLSRKTEPLTQFAEREPIVPPRGCQVAKRGILKVHRQVRAAEIQKEG